MGEYIKKLLLTVFISQVPLELHVELQRHVCGPLPPPSGQF